MTAAQTTLNGGINAAVTAATVRDVLGFASSVETSDLVQIDNEYILVTGGLGTVTWTVISRGYAGSTAAVHADGATVTRLVRGYTNATRVKTMSNAPNADDSYLRDVCDEANSWLNGEIGVFYGPSTDTSRVFDVLPNYSRQLYIPGGLRSFTVAELHTFTGESPWHAVTADVVARPLSWDRLEGLEANRLEFIDLPTGGFPFWYYGYGVARVTGVFGPLSPPTNLARIADTVAVWLYQSRSGGEGGVIRSPDTGELVVNRVLTPVDVRTMQMYRNQAPTSYPFIG